jgi:hypothetical protein
MKKGNQQPGKQEKETHTSSSSSHSDLASQLFGRKATVRRSGPMVSSKEFKVRSGPGKSYDVVSEVTPGKTSGVLLDVTTDNDQAADLSGKIYQWFKLTFPDGRTGWMREDLVDIEGDTSELGYGVIKDKTYAFTLIREQEYDPKAEAISDTTKLELTASQLAEIHEASKVERTSSLEDYPQTAVTNDKSNIIDYYLSRDKLASIQQMTLNELVHAIKSSNVLVATPYIHELIRRSRRTRLEKESKRQARLRNSLA